MTAEPGAAGGTAPVLELLARRYGAGARGRDIGPEADGVVRAMPVVLRIERDPLPQRTALLEAAATAAVAVCTDPRAQPGGEWSDAVAPWVDGRIRKIARRARGAHWRAVGELPGVTVRVGDAQARALLPGPVDEAPKVVSRLQIGGTELPADEPGPPDPDAPLVLLSPRVEMTVGKAAAQVGHATMLLAALAGWPVGAAPVCAVRTADRATWDRLCPAADDGTDGVVGVRDAGFTEVDPGTMTCLALARAAFARTGQR
ncbi:peptidyl-tRNA hydrolase [Pseudonocardia sp. ICBG1293]|uniref:peptidyl-tRNA hydrolase n=1 Tax=Pseudonocardia sp. ICBG1293 TaxID=2844382 RepID=UPI001CCACAB6|nr:peptidyl-tRNA hydrolase [Pseudonocardia sp. ICBG1293]